MTLGMQILYLDRYKLRATCIKTIRGSVGQGMCCFEEILNYFCHIGEIEQPKCISSYSTHMKIVCRLLYDSMVCKILHGL